MEEITFPIGEGEGGNGFAGHDREGAGGDSITRNGVVHFAETNEHPYGAVASSIPTKSAEGRLTESPVLTDAHGVQRTVWPAAARRAGRGVERCVQRGRGSGAAGKFESLEGSALILDGDQRSIGVNEEELSVRRPRDARVARDVPSGAIRPRAWHAPQRERGVLPLGDDRGSGVSDCGSRDAAGGSAFAAGDFVDGRLEGSSKLVVVDGEVAIENAEYGPDDADEAGRGCRVAAPCRDSPAALRGRALPREREGDGGHACAPCGMSARKLRSAACPGLEITHELLGVSARILGGRR